MKNKMKVSVEIIEKIEENKFSVGGWEVLLKTNQGATEFWVNLKSGKANASNTRQSAGCLVKGGLTSERFHDLDNQVKAGLQELVVNNGEPKGHFFITY